MAHSTFQELESGHGGASGAPRIQLRWLVRLRWWAAAGQLLTVIGVDRLLGVTVPLAPLLFLIAITALTNLFAALALSSDRRIPSAFIGILLAVDVFVLTGLLYWTGGPSNPFSTLYLVHVALAVVMLESGWAWSVAGLAVCGFAFLFAFNVPLPGEIGHMAHAGHDAGGRGFSLHLQGMWVAFTLTAALIAYFVARVSRALKAREAELAAVKDLAARNERLAALATLAAGAAHELGTPLGTIAIAAKELERRLAGRVSEANLFEDARLIRAEVGRCRNILDRMNAEAGREASEAPEVVRIADLFSQLREGFPKEDTARIEFTASVRGVSAPPRALLRALSNLIDNALDASVGAADATVRVAAADANGAVRFLIEDRGAGMSPEVRARAGEPFFTTKAPGEGMGLGLFLARVLAEELGGVLEIESEAGKGTRAALALPVSGNP